jgi:hypothetical protein
MNRNIILYEVVVAFALLLSTISCGSTSPSYNTIEGTWLSREQIAGGQATLFLMLSGSQLSGSLTAGDGDSFSIINGHIFDRNVVFEIAEGKDTQAAAFSLIWKDATLSGTCGHLMQDGSYDPDRMITFDKASN